MSQIEGVFYPTNDYEVIKNKFEPLFKNNALFLPERVVRPYIDFNRGDLNDDQIHALCDLCLHYQFPEMLFNDGIHQVSRLLEEITDEEDFF